MSARHTIPAMSESTQRYRCGQCGNLTRFDVFESRRSRLFHHYSLGGDLTIEEEEVLSHEVERVVCRWCGSADAIEQVAVTGTEP
jgi:ribosomal protein S27AE